MQTSGMQSGRLIVITGPSGVGKGTLLRGLFQRHPELYLSISMTTRDPRPGEVDGKDYYFVDREQFESIVAGDGLLEWAEFAGNCYGTPRSAVMQKVQQGTSVVLEIELAGSRQIQQTFPDAIRIFILPPSMAELEARIRKRGKDDEAAIARRLQVAQKEIEAAPEFDLQIVNDDLKTALSHLEAALFMTVSNQN